MTALADPDLARLVKLLRLLGSDQVGERASAALKVHEFAQGHSIDWDELLTQEEALPAVSVTVGGAQAESALEAYARGYREGTQQAAQMQYAQQAMAMQAQAAFNQASPYQQAYQGLNAGLGQATNPNTQAYVQTAPKPPRTWQDAAKDIMALPGWPLMQVHRPKEAQFVQSLLARNWANLTPKQDLWLRDICLRLGVEQW